MKNQKNQTQREDELSQKAPSKNTGADQHTKGGSQQSNTRRSNYLDEDRMDNDEEESTNRSGKPSQQSPGRNR